MSESPPLLASIQEEIEASETTAPKSPTLSSFPAKFLPPFLQQSHAKLEEKFKALQEFTKERISTPGSMLIHPIAHARNRYAQISPWVDNCVELSDLEHPYVNASRICLSGKGEEENISDEEKGQGGEAVEHEEPGERFIATQGPIDASHFWLLVWQEHVDIIIMLTQTYEKGQPKCIQYYPLTPDTITLPLFPSNDSPNTIEITLVSTHNEYRTEVREMLLKRGEEERTIYHFLFLGWPDFNVPKTKEDEDALLGLINMSRFRMDVEGVEERPRLVHCSAGVGRTGTFIALDHFLRELGDGDGGVFGKWRDEADKAGGEGNGNGNGNGNDEDPIFDAVIRLREQRMWMVYTLEQFEYIYRVIAEKW